MRTIKNALKSLAGRVAPAALEWLQAYRVLRMQRHWHERFQQDILPKLFRDGRPHVLSGPFEGMAYLNEVVWGSIVPRWMGSYEAELHATIRAAVDRAYDRVIDVGAAEGYYAVGFARLLPRAKVLAFDTNPIARRQQRALAALNNVQNLSIGTLCSHATFENEAGGRTLVVCDIEGFERELIDPHKAPRLLECDLLVETHGFEGMSAESMRDLLKKRFARTHTAEEFKATSRDCGAYRVIAPNLTDEELGKALAEYRPTDQAWLSLLRC